jgi:hypothetical protein
MRRNAALIPLFVVLLALLAPPAMAKKQKAGDTETTTTTAEVSKTMWRLYPVHYLDMREAGLLLEERIPEMLMDSNYQLRYEGIGEQRSGVTKPRGYLRIMSDAGSHERIAEILAQVDQPPATHVFHIFLLKATDDVTDWPGLPAGAEAALQDLRALLAFKGYEVLDSTLVRSSGRADVSLDSNYAIKFAFRSGPAKGKPLQLDFTLYSKLPNGGVPRHMETSFSMDIGETVVVGTSRPFEEDEALVVLLTASE